jgi:fumarate hydratase class II
VRKLREFCIEGTELNGDQVNSYVSKSLMLVNALSAVIGYDKAVVIAHKASDEGTLRQAALATGYVSAAEFDRGARPDQRIRPIWCGGEVDSAMTSARQGGKVTPHGRCGRYG